MNPRSPNYELFLNFTHPPSVFSHQRGGGSAGLRLAAGLQGAEDAQGSQAAQGHVQAPRDESESETKGLLTEGAYPRAVVDLAINFTLASFFWCSEAEWSTTNPGSTL